MDANQKRRSVRYRSRALARIPDAFEDQAIVKDISTTGCCIEYERHVSIKPHHMYILHIFPESNAQTEKFELLVESRWSLFRGNACEIGFSIISSPSSFSQYRHWCVKSK
jgi:hypothetical protein